MSVSLSYTTLDPVAASVRASLIDALPKMNSEWDWWCESINFFDTPEKDGRVRGSTKLFLVGYSAVSGDFVEVDPDEDFIMAWRDTQQILRRLAAWSRQHSLVWELASEGGSLGVIRDGIVPDEAQAVMTTLLEAIGAQMDEDCIEERACEILLKHAGRNG